MAHHYSKVIVCGAGTIGHSLALLHAMRSEVWLTDISADALEKSRQRMLGSLQTLRMAGELDEEPSAVMERIRFSQDLASCLPGADLIVEAISENPDIKRAFFLSLAEGPCDISSSNTLVASNTSSLDVFALAPATLHSRLYVSHHFVPPHILPLAEIVVPEMPLPGATEKLLAHYEACGAIPVVLKRFCNGFVINRIQTAIHREMFKLLEEDIVSPEDLDLAVKASLGIRIPVLGILKRLDFAGLDLVRGNMERLGLTPPKSICDLTDSGCYGVKNGKGFYDYRSRSQEAVFEERDTAMLAVRRAMKDAGLLSPASSSELPS